MATPSGKRRPSRQAASALAPERILAAALVAFAERGFDGATTREIAAQAGVPQGLVTYHFASKQALWEAAVDAVFGEMRKELLGALSALRDVDPKARWYALLKRFVRFMARRPELHRFITHEGSQDGPRLRYLVKNHLRPLFDVSVGMIREIAPNIDAAHLHYILIGAAAHSFTVAPEVELVTGRDPRDPEMVEAQADALIHWVAEGALANQPANSPRSVRGKTRTTKVRRKSGKRPTATPAWRT